jgi:DNA-binding transcriptional regulator YhcF (GntR family)
MEQVVEIQRLSQQEQKSYREICETLGVSSKTVAKALKRPEDFVEGYRREAPYERPALGDFLGEIEELLKGKEWEQRGGRRVRRTARWVYRQLRKKGFTGAESTVRAYVRDKFKQPKAACPIEHPPAAECQFDFGEYPIRIDGAVTQVHFCGATFPFSTRRFLFAYPAER